MVHNPKFSIITVCKNANTSIGVTVDSVTGQTYRDFEYLLIDGASTDGTTEIVRERTAGLAASIISEPDAGIYDAMNKGLRLARGEWVYFLNAKDCLYDARVLERIAGRVQELPKVELIYGDVIYYNGEQRRLVRFNWLNRWNLRFEHLCHQAVFARRSLFEHIGNFDLRYKINADYDWLLRVFCSNRSTAHIDFPVAFYDSDGVSARQHKQLIAERKVVRAKYLPKIIGGPLQWGYRGYRKGRRMSGFLER